MPLYEYRCQDCGDECELLVRGGETPSCPSCQSQRLERLLSLFAVNSAERSRAALTAARERYRNSKDRKERIQHEGQEIRDHLQEDYGVDLSRSAARPGTPAKPSSPAPARPSRPKRARARTRAR